jgi:citrate lyase subunit beta / citryl-CoA lyase
MRHGEVCIIALPETAEGLRTTYQIAGASPRVRSLIGGVAIIEGDIAWSVGFQPTVEGLEQLYLQSKLILDCRAAGVKYPIAGIFAPKINDLAMVEVFTRRAKQLGFTGAAVIHPNHVKIVNTVFQLTEEEIAHYEGLIAALEEGHRRGDGAVRYKGAMIDLAFLPIALDAVSEWKRRRQ